MLKLFKPQKSKWTLFYTLVFLLSFVGVSNELQACNPIGAGISDGGGGFDHTETLCVGESRTIGFIGCNGASQVNKEWIIEHCFLDANNVNQCTTTTLVTPGNLNYQFLNTGTYFIRVRAVDGGQVVAGSCSSCPNVMITVNGFVEPVFSVTTDNCFYAEGSRTIAHTVSILPAVAVGQNGTDLFVDWGDQQTDSQTGVTQSSQVPFVHTYSWPANTAAPTFNIQVSAGSSVLCPDKTYSKLYTSKSFCPELLPEIIEANCEFQYTCFPGLSDFNDVQLYGVNGKLHPFDGECTEFQQSGTYTFVIYSGARCPCVITYDVNLTPTAGTLSSSDSSVTPGDPFHLQLDQHNGNYIAYEILVTSCNGAPEWVLFDYGPAASFENYTAHSFITQQFLPCMLNDNHEFCFRARVFCKPITSENYENSSISNEICLGVCVK